MSVYDAATNGNVTKLRGLLAYGHDVNQQNNGWTPLASAVMLHSQPCFL